MHFATPPSTNLSIPLSLRLFPLPLHPLENGRGRHFADKYGISLEFCSRRSCTCVFAKCTRMYDTIPRDNTDTASSILLTLDCSVNICGCHLLHSLCNDPFYKPLHPPGLRPSPFLSILWRRKGDLSNHICVASEPPQSDLRSSSPTPAVQLRWQGKRCKPLSDGLRPPAPPVRLALRYGRQGERYIPNAIQAKSSYISANWPLLSKGLRGGKSRSDRVVSLLRRMIASEDAKNPL